MLDNADLIMAFTIEVVGAFIGVYFGFRYGLRQDKQNRMQEDIETKKSLIDSLIAELDYTILLLEKGATRGAFRYALFKESIDSTISSGFFLLISIRSQTMIREYLGGLNELNSITRRLGIDPPAFVYDEQKPLLPMLLKSANKLKTQLTSEYPS